MDSPFARLTSCRTDDAKSSSFSGLGMLARKQSAHLNIASVAHEFSDATVFVARLAFAPDEALREGAGHYATV